MKSKRKPAPAAPAAAVDMQPLESRVMLAGNITAVVRDGFLIITGDGQGNEFTVAPGTGTNAIKVTAAAGTTINRGRTEIEFNRRNAVRNSVRINTGGGNDVVRVEGATVARGLSVETADGNDQVFLTNTNVTERLFVSTGAGNDILNTSAGQVTLTTEIHMGAGNDIVELSGTRFTRRFSAKLGAGNDAFLPGNATFKREQRFVDGQGGNDAILEGDDSDAQQSFNFANQDNTLGWEFGISDFSRADQDNLVRRAELRALPTEINSAQNGLFLSSNNLSDDVFQFVKRRMTGLRRNTDYVVRFSVTFASNTPTGMVAIGGRPADDVHLKVGGSTTEPEAVTRKGGRVRVNLDKGSDNDTSGRDMTVISTTANGATVGGAATQTFRSVTRTGYHANPIRTDASGNLWLAIGTDSDFNGTTAIHIQSINVTLVPLG